MSSDELVALIHRRYWERLGPALLRGCVVMGLGACVAAAWLGRLGTPLARGVAFLLPLSVLVAFLWVRRWLTRESPKPERVIRTIVRHVDPELALKLEKAWKLLLRSGSETQGVSVELSNLHYCRLLGRVAVSSVSERGANATRWVNRIAAAALFGSVVLTLIDPLRIAEGANVLVATHGRAPQSFAWLELEPVTAQAPAYLRLPLQRVDFGSPATLPKGSLLTVRGVERASGRRVILTDGVAEVPFVSDGRGGVTARYELRRSVRLELAVRFGAVLIAQSPQLEVSAVADDPPSVWLEQAPQNLEVSGLEALSLRYRASDDHGLRQVELRLKSGARQEQRQLVQLDGAQRQQEGVHVLAMDDPFIAQSSNRVTLVIVARDDNAADGPKYGQSEAITLEPPSLGLPALERYRALARLRDAWVDWYAEADLRGASEPVTAHYRDQVVPAESAALALFRSGGRTHALLKGFLRAQIEKLTPLTRGYLPRNQTLAHAILALDAMMSTLAERDSAKVSLQLAGVASELELLARAMQSDAGATAVLRELSDAGQRLRRGAATLSQLGVLGADLGRVATAGAARIERSLGARDYINAERAAAFLAERLNRPVPSFVGGRRPAVESGVSSEASVDRSGSLRPSEADTRFERLAQELRQLKEEHAELVEQSRQRIAELVSKAEDGATLPDAVALAQALLRTLERLPELGNEPGSIGATLSLARESARGGAESLGRQALAIAQAGLRQAEGAFDEAERLLSVRPAEDRREFEGYFGASEQVTRLRRLVDGALLERRRQTEATSADEFASLSTKERALMERARAIALREGKVDHVLTEADTQLLEQAARQMEQAAAELAIGRGPSGLERQRAAQSLLERLEISESMAQDGSDSARVQQSGGRGSSAGTSVTSTSEAEMRERFRRRVLDGLGQEFSGEEAKRVRRYAEGLLR